MKTAFIGHRLVFDRNIAAALADAIQTEIDNGCKAFTMGMHGEFDRLALNACLQMRKANKNLDIEVVITSLNAINKTAMSATVPDDVKTVMYDIDDVHFKRRITLSNRQMIDNCDTLICYVDLSVYGSGAKTALRYAEKKGLKIVNLYRAENQPFYGMSKEQIEEYFEVMYEKISGKRQ